MASLGELALGTTSLFATPQKIPTKPALVTNKTPKKRGRPRKNLVAVDMPTLILVQRKTRVGRKVNVLVLYK